MKKVQYISLIGVLLILCLVPGVPSAAESGIVYKDEVTSDYNVKFEVVFYDNMTIVADAANVGMYSRDSFLYHFF